MKEGLGCRQVIGVDVDPEILYLARENCVELEVFFLTAPDVC